MLDAEPHITVQFERLFPSSRVTTKIYAKLTFTPETRDLYLHGGEETAITML